MRFIITFLFIAAINLSALAQISGNHVYNNRYNQNNREANYGMSKPVIIKDSFMLISAEILLNVKADSLVVTLGLNEEAKTVKDANTLINKRLNEFKTALKNIGISENDTYIDFITQTKIYDYNVSGANASQFIKGFEIKKNIIIKMAASSLFDKVIEAASESEIYDIVKVDYISNNIQKHYFEMLASATSIIKQKKDNYLLLSPVDLLPVPKIAAEKFFVVYPSSQYKEYQAFESSEVTTDYSKASLVKKMERKNKTFYYDKIDQSNFDLIVNNASPVVGIQYILQIQMQYDIRQK
jgi:uncharacterized protein YggE